MQSVNNLGKKLCLSATAITLLSFGTACHATPIFAGSPSYNFTWSHDGGIIGTTFSRIPRLSLTEACAYGGLDCPGGSNAGVLGTGGTETYAVRLGGTWGNSVNIDPIGFKYPTDGGPIKFYKSVTATPEPATLALFGLGLVGFWILRRRKA